jgi:hypothetical protein
MGRKNVISGVKKVVFFNLTLLITGKCDERADGDSENGKEVLPFLIPHRLY